MSDVNTLARELALFEQKKAEWLAQYEGKFVLVVDSDLLSVFDRPENAYEAGLEKVGNRPMLIKEISREDDVGFAPALTFGPLGASL